MPKPPKYPQTAGMKNNDKKDPSFSNSN